MSIMIDHAQAICDAIPEDQKRGFDPITTYNIIVLACKFIVDCAQMPVLEMKKYCQSNYDGTDFTESSTTATAFQLRLAARKNGTILPLRQARQWSHAMLLQSMNTPEETLATCVLECSNNLTESDNDA
jgi:hypothetical protein